MKAMRAFQATVDELSPQVPGSQPQAASAAASSMAPPQITAGTCTATTCRPCMGYQDVPHALFMLHEKILCILHDVLAEPPTPAEVPRSTTSPCAFTHVYT